MPISPCPQLFQSEFVVETLSGGPGGGGPGGMFVQLISFLLIFQVF
jgi:hypothetical protein